MKLGRLGWTLLIGGGAALVGGVAYAMSGGSSTSGQPTYGSPTMLPAGPYKNLGKNASLQPGETYLVSIDNAAAQAIVKSGWAQSLGAQAATVGFTVLGVWINKPPPAGWPNDDPSPGGQHLVVQVTAATGPIVTDQYTTVWTTGGAVS